jgi:predicted MFS family arabinose efflux permease
VTERARVWRAPGMLDLVVLSVFGFSGYAALLAVAPLWAVNGGATAAGSGLVNGVLLAATVLAQLAVPRALASWGTGRVLVAGLLLLGVPAPAYLLSDGLGWVLGLSAVRGLGFGILTVVGSAVAAHLVPAGRRGAAIGVYGLAVAVPNMLLLPGSVPVVDRWGFAPVFWAAALPVLGVPPALRLARVLRDTGHDRPVAADEGSPVRLRTLSGIVPPTVVLFSVTMAGGAVLTFAPQLTDSATAALVLLIMGITAALSRWLIGALADRRGARPFLAPILTCAAAAMAVCAWAVAREQRVTLIAAATVLGLCYGALQNLTLIVAFAAVGPQQLPAASAVWNIGFDTGTASGAVLAGVLATAYSFPVSLAAMAAFCLLTAVVAVILPSRRRTTRR